MPSETDFLNDAIGQIGGVIITAMDDGSPNANWCKTFYVPLRQAALRMHHWNFAEARVELAQEAAAPAFEFAFSYALPASCLKVKEYNSNLVAVDVALDPSYYYTVAGRFKIEGRKLLSNDGAVKIVYVSDVDNPNLWDPLFYQALATWLASKLALAINRDSARSQKLETSALGNLLPLAASIDGQEMTVLPYQVNDLLWGR